MHWYIDVLKQYFVFDGRAHRTEYWMFTLISFIVSIIIAVVEGVLGIAGFLGGVYSLAILCPSLGVGARRLHDTGRSAWWLLLAFIPCLGWLVLIVLFALDSEGGSNDYGPNPKGM